MPNPESPEKLKTELPVNTETDPSTPGESLAKSPSRQRWYKVLGVLLAIALLGVGWKWWQMQQMPPGGPPGAMGGMPQGVPVTVEPVTTATVQESVQLVGALEAPRSASIRTEIEGRIQEILVQEGDLIAAGQTLVRLNSDALQARLLQAQANLERTQARLQELEAGSRQEDIGAARASLQQAQARLRNARAGAAPEEIAQAQARIDAAKAEVDLANERVRRNQLLLREGAIAQDTLDEAVKEARTATAGLREAQRRLAELREGRSSDIDELVAQVEQQRQNLEKLERGARPEEIAQARAQVAEAEAQVNDAQVQVQDSTIIAPFAGIVGDIPVKIGDYLERGNIITTITQNETLELSQPVPLEVASSLQLGLPVEILDGQGKAITTGQISFISPNVDANTQTVLTKASFPNPNGQLRNQQLVKARVILEENSGVVIPITAVTRLAGETFVFVKGMNEQNQAIAQQKQVQLGRIQGNNYQVLSGLEVGEELIISGIQNLVDGVPIMINATEPQ